MIKSSAFGPKACEFGKISGDSRPTKQGVNIDMTRRRQHLDCSTAYMHYSHKYIAWWLWNPPGQWPIATRQFALKPEQCTNLSQQSHGKSYSSRIHFETRQNLILIGGKNLAIVCWRCTQTRKVIENRAYTTGRVKAWTIPGSSHVLHVNTAWLARSLHSINSLTIART